MGTVAAVDWASSWWSEWDGGGWDGTVLGHKGLRGVRDQNKSGQLWTSGLNLYVRGSCSRAFSIVYDMTSLMFYSGDLGGGRDLGGWAGSGS